MAINRRIMTRTLARQTGLTQPQVEDVLEKLIDLWKEELIAGGRIEMQGFMVLETVELDRGKKGGILRGGTRAPRFIRAVKVRVAKNVKLEINKHTRKESDE